jgi:hypothetical protein
MLDLRRATMRPVGRLVPMPLHSYARALQTGLRARGLTPEDVVSASYPKSGSTWLRFLVADIASRSADVNFTTIAELSPPLGAHGGAPRLIDGRGRFIKTHESYRAFPSFGARGLYMVRDGRDVAVSLYHFLRRCNVYDGPFEDYLEAFLHGRVVNYGSWQDHVTSWCAAAEKSPDTIAVLRYEDLLSPEGPEALRAALARIGWDIGPEAAAAAVERNSFQNMRKMESETGLPTSAGKAPRRGAFVRQGRAGQWQETFSDSQASLFLDHAGTALDVAGYAR